MKQITILNLILFCLSLILPNQNVFASAHFSAGASQNFASPVTTAKVQVVELKSASQITVVDENRPASLPAVCSGSQAEAGDFVQTTALLNFNQPANCFSLQISHLVSAQRYLAVSILPQAHQQVIVINWQAKISSPNFAPAPLSPILPILPLIAFSLALVFVAFDRRLQFKNRFVAQKPKNLLSLHQLQVLRC